MAGVQKYEDFHVWRLSVELRDAVFVLTESGKSSRDFKFRDQIREASSSPARNIAEGFGRYRPRAFANFVRIARASLLETRTLLQEGQSKKYFTAVQVTPLLRLQARAAKAAARLIQYLESCPDDFDPSSPPLPTEQETEPRT